MASNPTGDSSDELVQTARGERAARRGPFAGIILFIRQVIAELRKVTTPTRKELVNFTIVVLVFVSIMMAFVYGLDQVFSALAVFVFGNPTI